MLKKVVYLEITQFSACSFIGCEYLSTKKKRQGAVLHCEPERSNQETSPLHLSRDVNDVPRYADTSRGTRIRSFVNRLASTLLTRYVVQERPV